MSQHTNGDDDISIPKPTEAGFLLFHHPGTGEVMTFAEWRQRQQEGRKRMEEAAKEPRPDKETSIGYLLGELKV